MKFLKPLFLALFLFSTTFLLAQPLVTSLKTDYKTDPLGMDNPRPALSWIISSEAVNSMQDSYKVRAALSEKDVAKGKNLLWESGMVSSSKSVHVKYEGPPLKSFQRIFWQVKVQDNHGKFSKWSEVARFEMGVMAESDWQAEWISPTWEEDLKASEPSPYLRKGFALKGGAVKARLYISSHGLYQAEINGQRVGDQEFTPGWTSYDSRLQYQTYDVTSMLNMGENAIGIVLGDGWYRGNLAWGGNRNTWGEKLSAIARLAVTYGDGSTEVIGTDGSWKASKGPIHKSDIYNGEVYDATRELTGWSMPGYSDSQWSAVEVTAESKKVLIAPEGPPVRVVNRLEPLSIKQVGEEWMVDMGQNMVGWIQIKASGKRGDVITLRHAEVLDKEGNMYYTNLRAADATNTYTLAGGVEEVLEPHFTFQGFRYVMVSGYPGNLSEDDIRGMVIHSDMTPSGTFTCSNPLINQLQHNILWGLKGNFLDVPTDCPQRDERLGWTGDAQVFAPTACFNVDAATFYTKWLKDLAADQYENGAIGDVIPDMLGSGGRTGWADAGVVIPWVLYLNYGDVQVLKNQYESMKRWIGFMETNAGDDYIWKENWHYGDWLSFDDSKSDYMGAYTTKDLIATAYYSYSSGIVAKVARVLGKDEDASYYSKLSGKVKKAFNEEYVTPNGRLVAHTQTAYTLALAFGLLDGETANEAANHLAGDVEQFLHITTGFLGTPLISQTLTETGRNDLAYSLLNRTKYPSWLYPVTMGATTIWERWDGQKPDSTFQDPGMNSFNHYAYGAIGKWLYQVVAGIGIDENSPGYKHVIIQPRPGGGLTSAKATHESLYGTIVSGWELEGETMTMEVEIPVNTSATIHIPGGPAEMLINGEPMEGSSYEKQCMNGSVAVITGSGFYTIITRLEQ
ncbi:MAG: family 78 glycoside hydrolase catalytic domain [Bacteroidetes bacterium]|nr:family 78 glycoside hydrolase catalytic domain [Bacteroidota bacterium]